MKENVAISVKEAGMRFNLNQEHVDNLKEYFIKILKRAPPDTPDTGIPAAP